MKTIEICCCHRLVPPRRWTWPWAAPDTGEKERGTEEKLQDLHDLWKRTREKIRMRGDQKQPGRESGPGLAMELLQCDEPEQGYCDVGG